MEQHVTCGVPAGRDAQGASLPHERNQTKAHSAHVFRIPGQISLQDLSPRLEAATRGHGHDGHVSGSSDHEPSARGIPMKSQMAPVYIG